MRVYTEKKLGIPFSFNCFSLGTWARYIKPWPYTFLNRFLFFCADRYSGLRNAITCSTTRAWHKGTYAFSIDCVNKQSLLGPKGSEFLAITSIQKSCFITDLLRLTSHDLRIFSPLCNFRLCFLPFTPRMPGEVKWSHITT